MDRCFKHPKTVCMDYQTHAKFSLQMAYLFAVGSVKAVVYTPSCLIFMFLLQVTWLKKFNNIYKMLDVGMRNENEKID